MLKLRNHLYQNYTSNVMKYSFGVKSPLFCFDFQSADVDTGEGGSFISGEWGRHTKDSNMACS